MKASNDKQKVMILGVLFVVILGVGAFQFMGSGKEEAKKEREKKEDVAIAAADAQRKEEEQAAREKLVAGTLPQRDPFTPQLSPDGAFLPPTPPPPSLPNQPVKVANNTPVPPAIPGGIEQIPSIDGNPGEMPGNFEATEPPPPSVKLSGVVVGDRPMAVIIDSNGKQNLVKVGDQVSGRRVVAIRKGKVILSGEGSSEHETITMTKETNEKS